MTWRTVFASVILAIVVILPAALIAHRIDQDHKRMRAYDKALRERPRVTLYLADWQCTASEPTTMPLVVGKAVVPYRTTQCTNWVRKN